MKFNLIFLLIFFGISTIALSQKPVKIEVLECKYSEGKSKLNLQLKINNLTSDTIRMFRPSSDQFSNHSSLRRSTKINNQNFKAYRLMVKQQGRCPRKQSMIANPSPPTTRNVSDRDIIEILPKQSSEEIRIFLDMGTTTFCSNATYQCWIEYNPNIILLNKKQEKKLRKQEKKLSDLITEINEFLKVEKLSRKKIEVGSFSINSILNNNETLQKINQIQIKSETFELTK